VRQAVLPLKRDTGFGFHTSVNHHADRRWAGAASGRVPVTAVNVNRLEALSEGVTAEIDRSKAVKLDMNGLSELDTLGAWLLEKAVAGARHRRRHRIEVVGVSENYTGLDRGDPPGQPPQSRAGSRAKSQFSPSSAKSAVTR